MEVWKDIKGYEGLYRISNTGKVLSLQYMGGYTTRELKPRIHKRGYLWVSLRNNGVEGHYLIHRLVADAFIENPNNYACVNHKDENPANNNVENLEWCTHLYNVHYSMKKHPERYNSLGNVGKANKPYRNFKKIKQLSLDGEFICEFPNVSTITREKGYNSTHIKMCCENKQKTAYGYKWEYAT